MTKKIIKIPRYAIFLFKRFDALKGSKIQSKIDYPEKLRLSDQFSKEEYDYNLLAIVQHIGGVTGGHYKAIAKKGHKWYNFDDSKFKKIKSEKVHSNTAYILFYHRQ